MADEPQDETISIHDDTGMTEPRPDEPVTDTR